MHDPIERPEDDPEYLDILIEDQARMDDFERMLDDEFDLEKLEWGNGKKREEF